MGPLMIDVGNHFTRSRQRSLPVVASTAYTVAISSAKNSVLVPSGVASSVRAECTGASVLNDQRTQPLVRSSASRCAPLLPRNTVSPAMTGCERMVVTDGSAIDHSSSSLPASRLSMRTPAASRVLLRPKPQFSRPVTATGVSPGQACLRDPCQHIAETRDGHRKRFAALGSSPKVCLGVIPRADLVYEPESWTRRCAQRGGHDASDIAAIVASTACVDCRFPTVIRAPPSE